MWSPRTIRSLERVSEYEIWIYKDQTGFAFYPQFSFRDPNMSATAKSTSPVAPVATESRDWTKASTPELQSGSEDESDVLDAKAKERCRRKQVKREEKQRREEAERRACEEAEARAREEAEQKAREEAERKAREEAERQVREQAEKDRAEVQRRAAEVAARQRPMVQEASKKRMREEPEAGPVSTFDYFFHLRH